LTTCVIVEQGLPSKFGISFHLFSRFSSYTSMVLKMERVIRERWVLGMVESPDEPRRVHQGWKGKFLQVESPGKLGKGFGIACQSVVRVQKRIQNPP
jgi:hypothetical protein